MAVLHLHSRRVALRFSCAVLILVFSVSCSAGSGSDSTANVSQDEIEALIDEQIDTWFVSAKFRTIDDRLLEREVRRDSENDARDSSTEEQLLNLSVKLLLNEGSHTQSDDYISLKSEINRVFWKPCRYVRAAIRTGYQGCGP